MTWRVWSAIDSSKEIVMDHAQHTPVTLHDDPYPGADALVDEFCIGRWSVRRLWREAASLGLGTHPAVALETPSFICPLLVEGSKGILTENNNEEPL